MPKSSPGGSVRIADSGLLELYQINYAEIEQHLIDYAESERRLYEFSTAVTPPAPQSGTMESRISRALGWPEWPTKTLDAWSFYRSTEVCSRPFDWEMTVASFHKRYEKITTIDQIVDLMIRGNRVPNEPNTRTDKSRRRFWDN